MRVATIILSLTLLGYLSIDNYVYAADEQQNEILNPPPIKETLKYTYEEPKNIMFAAMIGGASHVTWTLSILDELSKRGHNITFVTREDHKKFADPYPHFRTIVLDGRLDREADKVLEDTSLSLTDFISQMIIHININFPTDYVAMKAIIANSNIDVVVCDFGSISGGCYEAAIAKKKPYIATTIFAVSADASATYINNDFFFDHDTITKDMSFMQRFNDMFITPAKLAISLLPAIKQLLERRHKAGCHLDSFLQGNLGAHGDALKIVNSLYGIESARPMGPLVEMVGPIITPHYDPLTPELKFFLDTHSRVLLIAFGQHAIATEKDLGRILIAVMENIENGVYDSFLWATRLPIDRFPKSITTQSGEVYHVRDMFDDKLLYAKFSQWIPQTAVLMHSSILVFLTHGGHGSFNEGLFAGKRLIVFPFFFDQFANAHNARRSKLGDYLTKTLHQSESNALLERVGRDINGTYQKNVNRFQALVQIHSRHGVLRGADLVEEVLFSADDEGLLSYRFEASRQMSFIKSHNLDLYATVIVLVLAPLALIVMGVANLTKKLLFRKKIVPLTTKVDPKKIN